jgi:hypothetical protein
MSEQSLPTRLQLKPGRSVLFVHAPPDYRDLLGPLPPGVVVLEEPTTTADVIQVFVNTRAELEQELPRLKGHLKPGGILWVTYHKATSRVKTDINRDSINAYAQTQGLTGVAMISVNQDWSALRLKASEP